MLVYDDLNTSERLNRFMEFCVFFPFEIHNLVEIEFDFKKKVKKFNEDELKLSIGIMGQVKAGKSSFLNALLFDGQPILPEAATPKTANLTRISYGEQPTLIVSYYSTDEWQDITTKAQSSDQGTEARVCRELIAMVNQSGVDISSALLKETEQLQANDVSGLIGLLNDYAGDNGKFTPLVKMTEIHLPVEELKGFDIVDTPGMNDPVQSRTQKTREYMASCDVVFFLSRSAQFLDQSDMDLLARQLPGKGVKQMVLIAGQFDGALCDDGYDRDSLMESEQNIKHRLSRRAESELEKLAAFRDECGEHDLAMLLRSIKTPIFASTYAHGFACWDKSKWNKGMQHVHEQFDELVEDQWDGKGITQSDWLRIGNFNALISAYRTARESKQQILQAQRDGLIPEFEREFSAGLKRLDEAVQNRMLILKNESMETIEQKQANCEHRINSIASRLQEVIAGTSSAAQSLAEKLNNELQAGAVQSVNLQVRTGTATETHSTQISTSSWYKPWTWGDTKTVYYTTTRSYQYLAASDAIEQVVRFGNENSAALYRAFNGVIYPEKLRTDLKRVLLNELETQSDEFDPAQFRTTLEGTLGRLKLPELKIELGDTASMISAHFSGEVCGDNAMEQLKTTLRKSVLSIADHLSGSFSVAVKSLCEQLNVIQTSLANELAKDLMAELNQLKLAFANQEIELARYAELRSIIADLKLI